MFHTHHKILFKNGKRVRTDQTVKITLREHAAEHKRLWKVGGHWQDFLAWKALSGQFKQQDIIKYKLQQAGKMTAAKYNLGRVHSKETRKKISLAKLGQKRSQQSCLKQSKTKSKDYIITTPIGERLEITNLKQWARRNNLSSGNMNRLLHGKLNFYKGYKVSYKYKEGVNRG